jgi:hypothetical protein
MPELFMNRQDVGNVVHRGISSRSLMNAQAFDPLAKMQQSRETVTFLPAQAVSPHRPVCISSRK